MARCPGTSRLRAFPSPERTAQSSAGVVMAVRAQGHHCSQHLPAGPAPCQTHKDETHRNPPRSFRRLKTGKSLKRQTPAPRADCCSCMFVIPRAWRSSPHISHYSTALDVIKPRETSKPAVTKPFVQTWSLCIENILKQFLIKLARS